MYDSGIPHSPLLLIAWAVENLVDSRLRRVTYIAGFVLIACDFRENRICGGEGFPSAAAERLDRLRTNVGVIHYCVDNQLHQLGAIPVRVRQHQSHTLNGACASFSAVL